MVLRKFQEQILYGMTLESKEHPKKLKKKTKKKKELKCRVFWAGLASFSHLDLINDPHIRFPISKK